MKKAIQAILIITLLPLCLIGCGPKTKVTSSWVNEQQVPKIGTILIIAISEKKTARRLWEDSFVEQFAVKNINAVASHTIKAEPIPPEEKSVLQIVESAKADTVIISHLIDSKSSTEWHPGSVHYLPNAFYHGMYGYYNAAYSAVYTPPTSVSRTVVRLESNMYDVESTKLLWAAQSSTVNPKLLKTDYESIVKTIMADLMKKKVL
jgi:hypothetical protein